MKKTWIWVVCLFLFAATVVPVLAAPAVTLTPTKSTANRGDTITVTVSISAMEACKKGGVELSFDSDVFELVSGEWLLTNTFMADFSTDTKDGVFAYSGPTAVSGDVFRFSLKVKNNAALANSAVKVNLTLNDDVVPKSVTITIACKHTYSAWKKVDESKHSRTCSSCNTTETAAHTWDSGKVTKAATCTTDGTKTYTCTGCGAAKTETIKAAGHSYSTKWSSNGSKHWHECTACGAKKDEAKHTPGAAATTSTPQTCTTCGYVLQPALGHTHNFENTWTKDDMGHWYACSSCDEVKDYENHSYENDCDTTCDVCGYIREAEHVYQAQWASDTNGHWHECSVCGERLEMEPHVPGPEATADSPQICIVCGYELTPMAGHTHTYTWNSDEENHWQECTCGNITDQAEHTWDEGTVTQEATQTEAGVKTYTCTACGREKTEEIPALSLPEETEPSGTEQQEQPGQKNGFPWWIVIVSGVGLLVLCGLFLVIGIIIGKKQTGKFSAK